ncbi:MAG TPA: GNAT family N-acetyltransferase [Chloroflexota bacterium]|nr:GNAT family N-acetyltransferase [Chloroflexota bacterium]
MHEPAEIRGERVTLQHLVRADVDEMATWPRFTEPHLQWANLDLTFPADRDAYFERGRTNVTRRRFAVRDEAGELIGTVGLRNLNVQAGQGTLGIIIRADAVGRGYGTDAIRSTLRYSFEFLGLRRVLLDVAENNYRAQHVYEKLGFITIGEHLGPQALTYTDMVLSRDAYDRQQRRRYLSNARSGER